MRAEHWPQKEKRDKPEGADEQRHEQATRPDRTEVKGLSWRASSLALYDQRVRHPTEQPNGELAAQDSGDPGLLQLVIAAKTVQEGEKLRDGERRRQAVTKQFGRRRHP
jgi:hypothetical protein